MKQAIRQDRSFNPDLHLGRRQRVAPRQALQQVLDLGACGRAEATRRGALGVAGQQAAGHRHVLAHRQTHAGLLLAAQQRQVGVEPAERRPETLVRSPASTAKDAGLGG